MPLRPPQVFIPPPPDLDAYTYTVLRDVMFFNAIAVDDMDYQQNHVQCWRRLAVSNYDTSRLLRHTLRPRATLCQFCGALMWLEERVVGSSLGQPRFGRRCNHGKVLLEPIKGTPGPLADLLLKACDGSATFIQLIRKYNTAYSMASLGVNVDQSVTYAQGMLAYLF